MQKVYPNVMIFRSYGVIDSVYIRKQSHQKLNPMSMKAATHVSQGSPKKPSMSEQMKKM